MFELTEIMRQKEDGQFAELLNRLREGMHTEIDIAKLKQRLTAPETVNSNVSSLQHLFTVNALVDLHNMKAFKKADDRKKCEIAAIDAVDGDVKEEQGK